MTFGWLLEGLKKEEEKKFLFIYFEYIRKWFRPRPHLRAMQQQQFRRKKERRGRQYYQIQADENGAKATAGGNI